MFHRPSNVERFLNVHPWHTDSHSFKHPLVFPQIPHVHLHNAQSVNISNPCEIHVHWTLVIINSLR